MQLSNFRRNRTSGDYIDLTIVIISDSQFLPILFLDTLQLIAIRPNKSRNIFIYGDIWLDLDPDMQFTYGNLAFTLS